MSKPLLFLVLGVAAVAYWAWRKSQVPEQGKLTEFVENTADKVTNAIEETLSNIPGLGGTGNSFTSGLGVDFPPKRRA